MHGLEELFEMRPMWKGCLTKIGIQSESVINSSRQYYHVAFLHFDSNPLILSLANIKMCHLEQILSPHRCDFVHHKTILSYFHNLDSQDTPRLDL